MIKLTKILIFITLFNFNAIAREKGQIEITANKGVEVFQAEKYYYLKEKVNILSDDFELNADEVKAFFDKDLYDIYEIQASGNSTLLSQDGIYAFGEKIFFNLKNETITINGINSKLEFNDLKMFSNILINVDNLQQTFSLQGESSILQNNEIKIIASSIKGSFKSNKNVNEIEELFINDKNKLNIITKTSSMFAMKANYNKLQDTIELHENVLIIRDQETIEGEYALIDITNESYKIKSEKNKKVKIILNTSSNE
jgi:lipopolysaccharide export system protein LptA